MKSINLKYLRTEIRWIIALRMFHSRPFKAVDFCRIAIAGVHAILLFPCFLGQNAAFGIELHFTSMACSASLAALTQSLPMQSLRKKAAEDAVDLLRSFRVATLHQSGAFPSRNPIRTDSDGSESNSVKVAERIKGIEFDLNRRGAADGKGNEAVVYGNVYRGKQSIESYLQDRAEKETEIRGTVANRFGNFLFESLLETGGIGIAGFAALRSEAPVDLSSAPIAIPLVAIGVDASRRIVGFIRSVDFHNGAFTNKVKDELASEGKGVPGQWTFHSYDLVLDQDAFRGAANNNVLWIAQGSNAQMAGELTRYQKKENQTHVQVDKLLSIDGQGSPVLTVVVRGHEQKPKYPVKAPEPQENLLETIGALFGPKPQLLPIPIPLQK